MSKNSESDICEQTYDPADPKHIMFSHFYRCAIEAWRDAGKVGVFRDLDAHDQLSSFFCGMLTACAALDYLARDDAKATTNRIAEFAPYATQMAREQVDAWSKVFPRPPVKRS